MHQKKSAMRFTVVYQVLVMIPQLDTGEFLVPLKSIWLCKLGLSFCNFAFRSGA